MIPSNSMQNKKRMTPGQKIRARNVTMQAEGALTLEEEKTSPVIELTLENFDALVEESQDIWLVMFWIPSCRMCHQMKPRFKQAA